MSGVPAAGLPAMTSVVGRSVRSRPLRGGGMIDLRGDGESLGHRGALEASERGIERTTRSRRSRLADAFVLAR